MPLVVFTFFGFYFFRLHTKYYYVPLIAYTVTKTHCKLSKCLALFQTKDSTTRSKGTDKFPTQYTP